MSDLTPEERLHAQAIKPDPRSITQFGPIVMLDHALAAVAAERERLEVGIAIKGVEIAYNPVEGGVLCGFVPHSMPAICSVPPDVQHLLRMHDVDLILDPDLSPGSIEIRRRVAREGDTT